MATRSNIAIKNLDGSYSRIYSHWDGYYEGVGQTLFNHYQNEEKVRRLISLGDLSSLHKEIDPLVGDLHTFDKSCPEVTVFYTRDRGEDTPPQTITLGEDETEESLLNEEYLYLWKDGEWWACGGDDETLLRLSEILSREEE